MSGSRPYHRSLLAAQCTGVDAGKQQKGLEHKSTEAQSAIVRRLVSSALQTQHNFFGHKRHTEYLNTTQHNAVQHRKAKLKPTVQHITVHRHSKTPQHPNLLHFACQWPSTATTSHHGTPSHEQTSKKKTTQNQQ